MAWLLVLDRLDPEQLRCSLRSLAEQTDPAWELSVAVVGPLGPENDRVLADELAQLPAGQVCVVRCPPGTGRGEAAAAALAASSAVAIALLDQGDQLAHDAVALLRGGLAEAEVTYADEDRISPSGDLADPALKPDWSPELLLSTPYLGRPLAIRRALVEAAGGISDLPDGDWEHDLMLRTTERVGEVAHIAEVLCHRAGEGPTSGDSVPSAGDGAVTAALRRRGEQAVVGPGAIPGAWRVRRQLAGRPSVSAVIPFRDGAAFLRTCVDSVTATAGEVDLELVLVDNGSVEPETQTLVDRLAERPDVVVVRDARPFNWAALNNGAAEIARGQVLLFLNNDIEAAQPGWLEALVAQALRPEVGAVGARLLYPGRRVQHAGLVVGLGGAA
ncbi:MAG TPA: glycosyltransferase, partial [Acidimicrobiales bacterium]|nr:glycosyltransferase [Acidimicrobiales bacterium]